MYVIIYITFNEIQLIVLLGQYLFTGSISIPSAVWLQVSLIIINPDVIHMSSFLHISSFSICLIVICMDRCVLSMFGMGFINFLCIICSCFSGFLLNRVIKTSCLYHSMAVNDGYLRRVHTASYRPIASCVAKP